MREDNDRRQVVRAEVCRFKKQIGFLFILLACFAGKMHAQCIPVESLLTDKERVEYDLYFKWGILMPKAGNVSIEVNDTRFRGEQAWNVRLNAWSTGVVDKVFRVRDTIDCYYSYLHPQLLYSTKRTNEGGYYQIDNLDFSYRDGQTHIHSFRRSVNSVKIDTMLVSDLCFIDLLGAVMYSRVLKWENVQPGKEYPLHVAMGRTVIPVSYRYMGQQIVERGAAKYRTRLFLIDIYDEAFTQSKEAAEIWIGDDENHLPIKLRAKLKVGAAEAYYSSSGNLKYPLNCRVVVPRH